jgi:hypothetical protein
MPSSFLPACLRESGPPNGAKVSLPPLERLQDGVGDLNDIAAHEKRIAAIGMRRPHPSPKRTFAAGLLTRREDARMQGRRP